MTATSGCNSFQLRLPTANTTTHKIAVGMRAGGEMKIVLWWPMQDPLSNLPLFATDKEIAVAIVGKERAAMWVKVVIPQLERKGFPRIDPLHDGRPVPLVRRFYDDYWGITAGFHVGAPDGEERLGTFKGSRKMQREA